MEQDPIRNIFEYWNEKKIMVHKNLTTIYRTEIKKALKDYGEEDLKDLIQLYATILEKGKAQHEKKYFWTYQWNLYEFLKRGLPKFDGKSADDYKKTQWIESPEAIIIKR